LSSVAQQSQSATPPLNHDAARRHAELEAIMAKIPGTTVTSAPVPSTPVPAPAPSGIEPIAPPPVLAENPSSPVPIQTSNEPALPVKPAVPAVDWVEEKKNYEKRIRDNQAALAPALQRAAHFEKQVSQYEQALPSILEKLEALERKFSAPAPQPVAPSYDPSSDSELLSTYPELADKLSRLSAGFNAQVQNVEQKYQREIEALKSRQEQEARQSEQVAITDYQARWWATLRTLHPDYSDFAPGGIKGQALYEWAQGEIPEYIQALSDPYRFTPQFVGKILSQFKVSTEPVIEIPRARTLADIANPSLMGASAPVSVQPPPTETYLTENQMRTIQADVERAYRMGDRTKADKLIDDYNKTLAHLNSQPN